MSVAQIIPVVVVFLTINTAILRTQRLHRLLYTIIVTSSQVQFFLFQCFYCYSATSLVSLFLPNIFFCIAMLFKTKIIFNLVVLLQLQKYVNCNSDTKFTSEEKIAIQKFRNMVKNSLYREHMKADWYLIHWLRAKDLDLNSAKDMLESSLKYRKENKIDELIHDKEMKLWAEKKFPIKLQAFDNENRPVLEVFAGLWDIRKAMLAGQRHELARYLDFVFESVGVKIRETRNRTRADVTQYIHLIDMSNYNLKQHGCAACLPYYYDMVTHYEHHFPAQARYLILINTPHFFQSVLDFMRPLMSPATRRNLIIFRHDKTEWSEFILNLIEPHQIPPHFGGIRKV